LLYPKQKKPGKFTFNREPEDFDLVWKLLKSTHAKQFKKLSKVIRMYVSPAASAKRAKRP
jgi:hypothetical protein